MGKALRSSKLPRMITSPSASQSDNRSAIRASLRGRSDKPVRRRHQFPGNAPVTSRQSWTYASDLSEARPKQDVSSLLQRIPHDWEEFDPDELSAVPNDALHQLIDAYHQTCRTESMAKAVPESAEHEGNRIGGEFSDACCLQVDR